MDAKRLLDQYRVMVLAREIDRLEKELTLRGEAFFHVAGRGHEAAAVLAEHLIGEDYLHCHYRDKALMLARGITPKAFFDSLYCKDASHSRGRQMSAHMSDRQLNIMSIVGPVGNNALQAVGAAAALKKQPENPIVLCSIGDGATQQGEFLEACAEAVRSQLPVLFFVEDNRWAISTNTSEATFYSYPSGEADAFYGMPIHRIDGRSVLATDAAIGPIIQSMRNTREPAIVVFEVDRLTNHTNADDQTIYRSADDIATAQETGDPVLKLAGDLIEAGVSQQELTAIEEQATNEVRVAEAASADGPEPTSFPAAAKVLPQELTHIDFEQVGDESEPRLTMREALRSTLEWHLTNNENVNLFGQDIEDPKGDVFGVTKGLSTRFGDRVKNSALTESTIIGVSIGRALAGERPVAFLQFADFLPLAYNQLASELGSLFWRTDGDWQAPVIVMVACGGYRPGLGPFHAQTLESIVAHIPGVDVVMPSTAGDAVGLLNAAFASQRPTLFFYPKTCLNDIQNTTSANVSKQLTPLGRAKVLRSGRDITLVGWGNSARLCVKAGDELERAGIDAEVIDLRSIAPWDRTAVVASAEKTARLIVVHEDNQTCGFGAEVLSTVAEKARTPVSMRRVARPDTYVPCNFANQIDILPSLRRVVSEAADLLDLDVDWIDPPEPTAGEQYVEAIGSGPADETVIVVELLAEKGDIIERGSEVALLEATKSVFELTSPINGTIAEVLVKEGDTIPVGSPIFRMAGATAGKRKKPITVEVPGEPRFTSRTRTNVVRMPQITRKTRSLTVGLSHIAVEKGSRAVSNDEILRGLRTDISGDMTSADILRRTGIESRRWLGKEETAISMAIKACRQTLETEGLSAGDIDLVICATTSPDVVTPSMACRILSGLTQGDNEARMQAYDINAACSGYLYALQNGFDYLQSRPDGRVLVVTAEALSPLLNLQDVDTAIIFGDAASATVLYGEDSADRAKAILRRPELSAKCDVEEALSVPLADGHIRMTGKTVFREAVRAMMASLNRVCRQEELAIDDLDLVAPHQANQRILDAIQTRIKPPVYSNIRQHGNTSSTSIPLCLSELLPTRSGGETWGLCAFGGGFTFGAGILETV